MGGRGIMLSFLVLVTLTPCVYSSTQLALAVAEHALGDALTAISDAVSSSEKQCSSCKDASDPDCVPHILAKLTDEVSVLEFKVSRLQSDVECDCPCQQVLKKDREPGIIVYQFNITTHVVRIGAPNGTVTTEKTSSSAINTFYYNSFSDRLFTGGYSIRSFDTAFEDEENVATHVGFLYGLAGDPLTDTLYFVIDGNRVMKVGMDGTGLEELIQSSDIYDGTLDACKGLYYFGAVDAIMSVNVKGDPHIKNVGPTTETPHVMDIDPEAQKIYYCRRQKVYVFDLVSKITDLFARLDYSCYYLKVWNGFVFVSQRKGTGITKITIPGGQKDEIFKGILPYGGGKTFTFF